MKILKTINESLASGDGKAANAEFMRRLEKRNSAPNPEIMIDGYGGVSLEQAIKMIKQDARKLDHTNIKKSDILMIRNASAAIAKLLDEANY